MSPKKYVAESCHEPLGLWRVVRQEDGSRRYWPRDEARYWARRLNAGCADFENDEDFEFAIQGPWPL